MNTVIAVAFDGTLANIKLDHQEKRVIIESPRPLMSIIASVQSLERKRELRNRHFVWILWTCRTGKALQEAIEYCTKHDVLFDDVNSDFNVLKALEKELYASESLGRRKIYADLYLDDKSVSARDFENKFIEKVKDFFK